MSSAATDWANKRRAQILRAERLRADLEQRRHVARLGLGEDLRLQEVVRTRTSELDQIGQTKAAAAIEAARDVRAR